MPVVEDRRFLSCMAVTATELSRSPPLGSGTVFLSTSHLLRHALPSTFVSRHTIIIFVIH